MGSYFKQARFAIFWLVVFMIIRLILGARGVPYERGTIVSMVMLSWLAALFYGAFCRRFKDYKWYQAALQGGTIAFSAQVLIFAATVISFLVGVDTYFNHPIALNVPEAVELTQALGIRVVGLLVNTVAASIIGAIGWATGVLLPKS